MKVLLVVTLVATMAVCAIAEHRQSSLHIKERFMKLSREQQVARIKTLLVRGFLDDKLEEFLESMKDMIKNGSEDWDLPPMDPFLQDHLEAALEHEIANLNVTIDELSLTGLSDYTVNLAKFDLVKQNISFNLTFSKLQALAEHYLLDALVANMVPIFGEGSLDIVIEDLSISGSILLGTNGAYIFVQDLQLDVTIESLKTNLTGLLGGGDLGDVVNDIISNAGPDLWNDLKMSILPGLCEVIEEVANEQLDDLTIEDIIDIIMGNNEIAA